MKRKLLLLSLLPCLIMAKDLKIKAVSKVDFVTDLNYLQTSVNYIPLNLTITKNDKLDFILKIRGNRDDIKKANEVIVHENIPTNLLTDTIFDVKRSDLKKVGTLSLPSEKFTDFNNPFGSVHYHGPHEHDEIEDCHEHEDDENHEHFHSQDVLIPYLSNNTKFFSTNDDFQVKLGLEYRPTNKSNIRLIYMPTYYNGDDIRYKKNSFVLSGKYIHLFDNKFSLAFRPKLSTEKFIKPTIGEIKTDFRYALNNDTTLSAYMYNALQLSLLNEQISTKNSLELTYDYNTEEKRHHQFWEIVDHDHEKIDQFKAKLRLSHDAKLYKAPKNEKLRFQYKDETLKGNLELIYKKTNFVIPKLVFENKAKLDFESNWAVFGGEYSAEKSLYSNNKAKTNIEVGEYTKDNINYTSKDKSIKEEVFKYKNNEETNFIITTRTYKGYDKYTNRNLYFKKGSVTNKSIISYKKIKATNEFSFTHMNKYLENVDFIISDNTFKLETSKRIKNKYVIKPHIRNYNSIQFINNEEIFRHGVLAIGTDFYRQYNQNGFNIKAGLKTEGGWQYRKAQLNYVPIDDEELKKTEANKWVYGIQLKFEPYVNLKYMITDHLKLSTKLNIPLFFAKDKFNTSDDKFTLKMKNILTNFELKYEW